MSVNIITIIELKNNGNTYSYNPNITFAIINEKNEVMDSKTGPLFDTSSGVLPSGSIKTKKFGIQQLEIGKKYKIFISVGENEYCQDLEF